MEDITPLVKRLISATPKDAIGVRVLGLKVTGDRAIITQNGIPLVIPMNRHGERIGHQGSPEHSNLG
jgi:hypothetical protein